MGKHHFRGAISRFRRYQHIMAVLAKYGLEEAAGALRTRFASRFGERISGARVKPAAEGRSRPARVRMALEELGPTFIKLGQLLSTRPDVVPPEYIRELERLQDQVPPDEPNEIIAVLEEELGDTVDAIFLRFDRNPIAAGSIAQVHRALTRQGQEVVVKIRRPRIEQTVRAECEILEDLAGLLRLILSEQENVDPQRMVAEFAEAVLKEVDLTAERRNQLRFINSFRFDRTVHIPKVYEQYCSEGVLTMEYIDGIRPHSVQRVRDAGLEPKVIARNGANFVLRQIFELGILHTDPHPGNFFLLPENVLVPIDFGQVVQLTTQDQRLLNELVQAVVFNDSDRAVRAFERAEMITEHTDVNKVAREAETLISSYHSLPPGEMPFDTVVTETFEIIRRNRLLPPAQFTLMLKSMMTIQNFSRQLDPKYDMAEQLRPFARRFSLQEMDPRQIFQGMRKAMQSAGDLATRFPEDVNAILSKFRLGKFQVRIHHEHLENLTSTLDKSSNRISFALIIAALLVGSSMLVPQEGSVLGLVNLQTLGIVGYLIAAVIGIWLVVSIIRGRHF